MVQAITVQPSANGWTVKADTFGSEMYFRSGAEAETAARKLGQRIAGVGDPVEIQIYLRDGALAGRYFCPAEGD